MAKNEKNFVSYYNEFKNKVYSYFLYRVSFDQKLAEDLTSEVFLKAFKKFSDFNSAKPFRPWIYAISRNHLINYYQSVRRDVSLTQVEGFLSHSDTSFETRQELARVMKVISQMEAIDREVLLLRFSDGLDNSEIAELLKKDQGAIRTRISRSLNKLRQSLNGQQYAQ